MASTPPSAAWTAAIPDRFKGTVIDPALGSATATEPYAVPDPRSAYTEVAPAPSAVSVATGVDTS